VIIYRGQFGSEIYGRTEDIFPELDGKLYRDIADHVQLIRWCYNNNRCLLRITRTFVATALRHRILSVNLESHLLDADRARRDDFDRRKYPIVLIGLRVENRTLVDLAGYCHRLAELLLERTGGCVMVIDGHVGLNPEVGRHIPESTREDRASVSPLEVERELVRGLRDRFADSNLKIVENVGVPIRQSIYWCMESNFFVAIGGTGLAKYRWVCNKPGLVLTNQSGLSGGAMYIYQAPIMEEAEPIWFLDKKCVVDRPGAVPVIPFEHNPPEPFWVNFTIDEAESFRLVESLLDRYSKVHLSAENTA
jgi:hypothetical protein